MTVNLDAASQGAQKRNLLTLNGTDGSKERFWNPEKSLLDSDRGDNVEQKFSRPWASVDRILATMSSDFCLNLCQIFAGLFARFDGFHPLQNLRSLSRW